MDVLPNPNVGADVLGTFDPKANGIGLALVVDVLTTEGVEETVVFAAAPKANIGCVLVPSGFGGELIKLDGVPNETFALVAAVDGFVAGLPKLNEIGADVV